MKMNYPKICVYLAFALIVALVFIVMQCQSGVESDLSQNAKISKLEQMDRENKELQTRQDSVISSERHARKEAHRTAKKSDSLYSIERSGIQRTLKQLLAIRQASGVRVDTITVAIEGQYQEGAKTDSIQIQKLETRLLSDSLSFENEIMGWVTKFNSEVKVSEAWRIQAVESTRDAQKFKRQRNQGYWAVLIEALVIVLLIL